MDPLAPLTPRPGGMRPRVTMPGVGRRGASPSRSAVRPDDALASNHGVALTRAPSLEAHARTLLAAVTPPGMQVADPEVIIDYAIHMLRQTNGLQGLLVELADAGDLDRDLRQILGVLFGLSGSQSLTKSPALKQVEAALADVAGWFGSIGIVCELPSAQKHEIGARCPISFHAYADIVHPVVISSSASACVFEAEALLEWMHVSMQTPGRQDCAVNPLDRSSLWLRQLLAVRWCKRADEKL